MTYIISILLTVLLSILFPTPIQHVDITLSPKPLVEIAPEPTQEELILQNMSLEEKVGQLFIFGFDGTTLTKENRKFLEEYKVGGILLLKKNVKSPSQLKKLIKDIQSINNIPLFISIDQEGGEVARIRWQKDITKSQPSINTAEEAYEDAFNKGTFLRDLGINMNFAPVVEYITSNKSFLYNRTFRGTKEQIYLKNISAIEGYKEAGIISVPKHYPGHSNTSVDSHNSLPTVKIKMDQWREYIEPFSHVIEKSDIDAMMVGHVKFPNIDSENPTTLSSEIINHRLIGELDYKGIVISDDMEMAALDNIDTDRNMAKKALEAGNDILIYSKYSNTHPNIQKDVYEYILEQSKDEQMEIDNRVLKILKVKIKYGIL